MSLSTLPRQVFRTQYRIARRPWDVIEHRMAALLPENAPVRLAFERWLGEVDAKAGPLLGDEQLQNAGAALRDRAEELRQATVLERHATARLDRAQHHLVGTLERTAAERDAAREKAESKAEQVLAAEDEGKRQASAQARQRADAAKDEAQKKAGTRLKSVSEANRAEQERVAARERRQEEKAQGKLESASQQRAAAADKEERAERLGELAAAEREERRAERRDTG